MEAGERESYLREHAEEIYAELTDDFATPQRVEELVERAAQRFPGLAPTVEELAAERERPLAEKEGAEIAQGLLLAHVLASPRAGAHLVWSMLRPTAEALARLPELQASGEVDLGAAVARRERKVCSWATTAAPSPMAVATRLTEPERTSPTAKIPSTPVSSAAPPAGSDFR